MVLELTVYVRSVIFFSDFLAIFSFFFSFLFFSFSCFFFLCTSFSMFYPRVLPCWLKPAILRLGPALWRHCNMFVQCVSENGACGNAPFWSITVQYFLQYFQWSSRLLKIDNKIIPFVYHICICHSRDMFETLKINFVPLLRNECF